jgi:hypothetical protein
VYVWTIVTHWTTPPSSPVHGKVVVEDETLATALVFVHAAAAG